jgi:hypothetical protein
LKRPNIGTFTWDTKEAVFGDGDYMFRLALNDSSGGISEPVFLNFSIYNPDAPVVKWLNGPREQVREGTAEFRWGVEDPDQGETGDITFDVFISSGGESWLPFSDDMPNEDKYVLDVSEFDDNIYDVKFVFFDNQPGNFSRSVEYIFEDLLVNNINDAPEVEIITNISMEKEYEGEITLEWTGVDADGDNITYTLYYLKEDTTDWILIPGAENLNSTIFTWNISEMEEGRYKVKMIAMEDYKDHLTAEIETTYFHIRPVKLTIGGDGDGERAITVNSGLIAGLAGGFVILVLIVVWILFLNIRKKKNETTGEEIEREE